MCWNKIFLFGWSEHSHRHKIPLAHKDRGVVSTKNVSSAKFEQHKENQDQKTDTNTLTKHKQKRKKKIKIEMRPNEEN